MHSTLRKGVHNRGWEIGAEDAPEKRHILLLGLSMGVFSQGKF